MSVEQRFIRGTLQTVFSFQCINGPFLHYKLAVKLYIVIADLRIKVLHFDLFQ